MKLDLTQFKFTSDYILVKAIDVSENVQGLIRPEQYEDKSEFGEVISAGSGKLLDNGTVVPLKCSAGDIVFFGKYSSEKVRINGEDYLVIRDDDVIAVK